MNIPVCFAINLAYINQLKVVLLSLFSHAYATTSYQIFVLHYDIHGEEQDKIERAFADYWHQHSISFTQISSLDYNRIPIVGRYGKETDFRLFLPTLLPSVGKIIYLDVDILILADLSDLYSIDISGCAYAALSEKGIDEWNRNLFKNPEHISRHQLFKNTLGFDLDDIKYHYVNAGVLVINNNYWREHHYCQRALEFLSKYATVIATPDQDALNYLALQDGIELRKYISGDWNFITSHIQQTHDVFTDMKQRPLLYRKIFDAFSISDSVESYQPKIIHYAFRNPWKPGNQWVMYYDLYKNYARMTGWNIDESLSPPQKLAKFIKKAIKFFLPYGLVRIYAKLKEKI
jgi:lipopolysaccharide biosynthesis glycosyltransferase